MTTLHLQWPQIIWIVLAVMGFTIHAVKHGTPIGYKHSWWTKPIHIAITFALLWCGFFNPYLGPGYPLPTVCHER
jgi:hypothetical protein